MNDISIRIKDLENQIEQLPKGTLVYKKIRGNEQPYLQQTLNGKTISTYIKLENREKVLKDIEERNQLIAELKALKAQMDREEKKGSSPSIKENIFKTQVVLGLNLRNTVNNVRRYKRRECFKTIEEYLYNDDYSRVLVLYGLRRTGKTTLIKQAILSMTDEDLSKTAFVQISFSNTLGDLNMDLRTLRDRGYKYIFIDEITLADDFIEGSAFLPDIFVAGGMKIVLSGTDSLGFWISEDDQLFDRTVMVHTTFIPYFEFESVLGVFGIDDYIQFGGTMSIGGVHYNDKNLYSSKRITDEYVDSAIARNIQHSLKCYQDGGHFRHLEDLFESDELTSAINRVVEDTNHKFTIDCLTRDFISHDLGTSMRNLRTEDGTLSHVLDDVDKKKVTQGLKEALEILNKNEQTVQIDEYHRIEIEEYLQILDLIYYIDVEAIPKTGAIPKMTVITQPGLRYSQAESLIEELFKGASFSNLSALEKSTISERILNEVKGRMMEEIVLLETSIRMKDKWVFKLQFSRGEFDMVVQDKKNVSCRIYEIKHSDKIVPDQYKNLIDQEKCDKCEFSYGRIDGKFVIYRGEDKVLENGIAYLNVENYLKSLYHSNE